MRLAPLALALLLPCAPPAAAERGLDPEALATATALREQALKANAAWTLVESLTTEIGPRPFGSLNDPRAVAWAEARFKALGYDRVYLEPVTGPVWQRVAEHAEVVSPYPQPLLVTLLGGSVGLAQPLQAEVVEFADLAALAAAPAHSLDGKIAFIANRTQRSRDGSGYGPAVKARRDGASTAAGKGAAALLIRSIGTDRDRLPHTGTLFYAEGVTQIPAAALSNPDADQLSRMLARGVPVQLRLDLQSRSLAAHTSYNVVGEIRGRELADEFVTLGGHLDSWDLGTGAIDDGAGVAITMAAGALIGQAERAPRRSVRVIAFANEERGLFGGKAHAAGVQAAGQFDAQQLGAESDFGAGRIYALQAGVDPAAMPTVQAIAEVLAPLGIAYEAGGGAGSDIEPLAALGVPWFNLAQDGSDYFDLHHTGNDTLDKIEPKALDQQVAAYAAAAYLAADSRVDFGRLPASAE